MTFLSSLNGNKGFDKHGPVLGNSTAYLGHTDVSTFPDHGCKIRRVNGMVLCRNPTCKRRAASAEAFTTHADSFELIQRTESRPGVLLDLVWIVAAWRSPWRQSPHRRSVDTNVELPTSSATRDLGLPRLHLLPPETIQTIRNFTVNSL